VDGEEDEELVAAVRAGADLAVIAEQHGRTRSAIVSRLLRMIPAREAIPRRGAALLDHGEAG
jgi:hypothetical protein